MICFFFVLFLFAVVQAVRMTLNLCSKLIFYLPVCLSLSIKLIALSSCCGKFSARKKKIIVKTKLRRIHSRMDLNMKRSKQMKIIVNKWYDPKPCTHRETCSKKTTFLLSYECANTFQMSPFLTACAMFHSLFFFSLLFQRFEYRIATIC